MATLYANKLKKNDSNFAVHDASDEHNLRLKEDNPNHDPTLSHNNFYQVFNPETGQLEVVEMPSRDDFKKLRQWQQTKLKNYARQFQSSAKNEKDRKEKSNTIAALKKWIESDKTHKEERVLYQSILEKIEAGQGVEQEEILTQFNKIADELRTDDKKISRYNDKRKRLKTAANLKLSNPDRRVLRSTKKQTEILFKVPDHNKITLTNEEMLEAVDTWKKFFPDFQILYVAIHHDEDPSNPHVHFAISNYNTKTQQFDLYEQEHEALKKYFRAKHKDKPLPGFLSKPRKELDYEERQAWGRLEQDFYFDIMNRATKKKYNFKKRTEQEIKEANHKYQKEKAIVKREHNRQKKLQEQREKTLQTVKENENKNVELKEENEKLKKENTDLEYRANKQMEEVEALYEKQEKIEKEVEDSRSYLEKIEDKTKEVTQTFKGLMRKTFSFLNINRKEKKREAEQRQKDFENARIDRQMERLANTLGDRDRNEVFRERDSVKEELRQIYTEFLDELNGEELSKIREKSDEYLQTIQEKFIQKVGNFNFGAHDPVNIFRETRKNKYKI